MDDHQPGAEKLRQDKQEDWNPALPENGRGDHQPVNGDADPGVPIDLGELAFRNERAFARRHAAQCVPEKTREIGAVSGHVERAQDQPAKVGRTGNLNFRVAANDDGIAVMTGVTPAPDHGFPHHHERGDLIQHVVHPVGPERRAVTAFVPP